MYPLTSVFAGVVLSVVVVVGANSVGDRTFDRAVPEAATAPCRASLMVPFRRGATQIPNGILEELDRLANRARADPRVRVLVQGFAYEERDFEGNLRLADARAQAIASALLARKVPRSRIVVAAGEASPDDRPGQSSEVEIAATTGQRTASVRP